MSDQQIDPGSTGRRKRALRRHSTRRIPERSQSPAQEVSARLLEPPRGFLAGRATRLLEQKGQRPMTYSSISNANPFLDEIVPSPLFAQSSGLRSQTTSPSRLTGPPPLQLTLISADGTTSPARMPNFSVTSAAEDMRLLREAIAPDQTDKLGQIAASEDGFWMFHVSALNHTYRTSHWVKTDLRVHPQMDPRLLCPGVHEELIKVCNEGFHEDGLLQKYSSLVASGIDEGRRHLGHLEITGVGGYDKQGKRATSGYANDSAFEERGRPHQPVQGSRSILRSPEREREQTPRDESQDSSSTRGVTFNLYSASPRAEDGAPSEVFLEPAGRIYNAETAILRFGPSSARKSPGKNAHVSKPVTVDQRRIFTYYEVKPYEVSFSQYVVGDSPVLMMMPDGRPVPKSNAPPPFWPRFERDLPAQSAAQEQVDRSPQLQTPLDFSDPAIVAQLEQPWTTPKIRLRIHPEFELCSGIGSSASHQTIENILGHSAVPVLPRYPAIDNPIIESSIGPRQPLGPGLNFDRPLPPPLRKHFLTGSPFEGSSDSDPFMDSADMSSDDRTPSIQSETKHLLNQLPAYDERMSSESKAKKVHSLDLSQASPEYPPSDPETDELLRKFPGIIDDEEKYRLRRRKVESEAYNAPRTTFFDVRPRQSHASTFESSHAPAVKSPVSVLAGLAGKMKLRISKGMGKENAEGSASPTARPRQFMRKISQKITGRQSVASIPSRTRPRSGSAASLPKDRHELDLEAADESEDDNQVKISMAPGDQMWHIGRVEFILNQVANQFLMSQKEAGRMDPDTVTRISKRWLKQNRPQVVEFMFDLNSQLELTRANLDNFMFCGPRGMTHLAKQSLISSWRSITRELMRRTFCLPDHALKKLMVDSFRVLEMLGGDNDSFCEFRDIQRYINQFAGQSARHKGKETARNAHYESGVSKKLDSPLLVSDRGIVDDDEQFYNDGIYKG